MWRWLAIACWMAAESPALGAGDEFEQSVRPVLVARCQKCHGAEKASGGLRLDSRSAMLTGGDSGPTAIEGHPDDSLIVRAIEQADELRMPPGGKLRPGEIGAIRRWIATGLPWPDEGNPAKGSAAAAPEGPGLWSLRPIRKPEVPQVFDRDWSRTEIDRFLLASLESKGLGHAPPADRRTWIRRATYDLTGLPPSAEDVEAFLVDDSPDACERVVDRLLASPSYGEKWGRHWLDLARYADTAGENSDHPTPHSWRYRNWVIEAHNRDMPYDEFVRMQVAGDRIAAGTDRHAEGVVATGFLAIARRFGHDIDKDMHLTHEDVIDTMGRTFLGLSLACARCHDHKYDPISTRDYYALAGILQSTRFSFPGCEPLQQPRDLVPMLPEPVWQERTRPHREALAAIDSEIRQVAERIAAESRSTFPESSADRDGLSQGSIPDGGEQVFPELSVDVEPGSMIRLVVSPRRTTGPIRPGSIGALPRRTGLGGAGRSDPT
ncbi:MAG: DUF1549 domain-containing protein [Isosphaeraceae bacterium]